MSSFCQYARVKKPRSGLSGRGSLVDEVLRAGRFDKYGRPLRAGRFVRSGRFDRGYLRSASWATSICLNMLVEESKSLGSTTVLL